MKAIVMVKNQECSGWFYIADSAISNTGKPFYLPEGSGPVAGALSIAIRISRLGKGISSKFASRYYSEIAPAVHFHLPELASKLRECGLPTDPSHNFDRALMVGEFKPFSPDAAATLRLNGEVVTELSLQNPSVDTDKAIEDISRMNTLKMGDLLLPALSHDIILNEGDLMEVAWEKGEKAFHVKIR